MGWVNKNSGTKRYQQGGPIATDVAPVQKYAGGGGIQESKPKKDLTLGDVYKKGKKGIEAGKKAVGKVKEKVIQKVANIKVKDIAKVAGAVIAPRATAAAKLSKIASKTIRKKFKKKDDEKRKGAEKATMYQQGGQIEEAGEMQKKRKPGKSLKRKLKKSK